MHRFFALAIQMAPRIRNVAQLGFALLVALVYMILNFKPDTPPQALVFVVAVVPLIIAMQFVADLRKKAQFICVLVISGMAVAFLGTGIVLAIVDPTPTYDVSYQSQIESIEQTLDQRYLVDRRTDFDAMKTYPDYRRFVLGLYAADTSDGMTYGLDQIVSFYDGYLQCRIRIQCLPSKAYDERVTDFWYTFRPIIEERRLSFWGPAYAASLQRLAEAIQPPHYRSQVAIDAGSGATKLVYPVPAAS
jgi:hypothetical protein